MQRWRKLDLCPLDGYDALGPGIEMGTASVWPEMASNWICGKLEELTCELGSLQTDFGLD